jgi:hypothetical protein
MTSLMLTSSVPLLQIEEGEKEEEEGEEKLCA